MTDDRPTYYEALAEAHRRLRPRGYLEIGVHEGHSLQLAQPTTRCLGIDPSPNVAFETHSTIRAMTSDDYFANHDPVADLGAPLDLVFIDGLHLFEQALRDVVNVERHSHSATVILIHDCLPIDAVTAARERTTMIWSGDVWKVMVTLARHRPDLSLTTLDAQPTGLGVVRSVDPGSDLLGTRFDELVSDLIDVDYEERFRTDLSVMPADRAGYDELFGSVGS